jgi:sugar lactone lactonase YvrE
MKQMDITVSTVAGGATGANNGTRQDGAGGTQSDDDTSFTYPCGVAVDGDGNAFVTDFCNHRIYKVTPQGQVSTLAGGTSGSKNDKEGDQDGEVPVIANQFSHPTGVAVDGDGNIIVADTNNHRIRRITPHGHVSTLAGTGRRGYRDGEGTVALFNHPTGLAVDEDGNIIVADTNNHCIRKITPQGQVFTLAGIGKTAGKRDGDYTSVALFNHPVGVAVDGDAVIVVDADNNRICKITQAVSSTPEGGGRNGRPCGIALVRTVYYFGSATILISGVAVDGDGNIIVADESNHRICKITPLGHLSYLAGTVKGHRDGDRASALFNEPSGVAVDGNGDVIVADSSNRCIRRVATHELTTPRVFLNHGLPQQSSTFASDLQHNLFDSGSFHDVCFVVEQERIEAHRCLLSARCEYFKSMFGDGFKEGDSAEIHIKGTTSAAFKALVKYLYTDSMEVDDAMLCDLAKLCDQYRVERLHNHCLKRQNAPGTAHCRW